MNSTSLNKVFRHTAGAIRIVARDVPLSAIPQRTFSSHPWRQQPAGVPTFSEVSSPELQDTLTQLREKVFLLTHITKRQRDLIFKPKHKKALEAEPVMAVIAGEEFRLKHIDPMTGLPGKADSLFNAVKLMKDKRDWDNLPNLLHGLTQAKFMPYMDTKMFLLRKIGKAGRQDVLLECLRRADQTGLTLTQPNFVVQVFFQMQQKAYLSEWDAKETKKALEWAEMVKDMMADAKHQPLPGSEPLPNLHEVHGLLLELAAVRASKHQDGKDTDGKVEKYATDLLACPREFPVRLHGEAGANFWLATNIAVLHGLRLAQVILGPTSDISAGLKTLSEELGPRLLETKDKVAERPRKDGTTKMGVLMYEKLIGLEPL